MDVRIMTEAEKAEAYRKELERKDRVFYFIVAAMAIAVGIVLFAEWRLSHTQPVRERAAWNEGYYGVDHTTAVAMAEQGIGKTAAEILK